MYSSIFDDADSKTDRKNNLAGYEAVTPSIKKLMIGQRALLFALFTTNVVSITPLSPMSQAICMATVARFHRYGT